MTPCRFTFDGDDAPTFEGFDTGERWNGWPLVAVTPQQLEPLIAWLGTCDDYDDEHHRDTETNMLRNIARKHGHVELSGFTPTIVESQEP